MAIPNQTGTANSKASIWETALPRLGGAIPAESIRPNNMSHSRHTSLTERCSLMNNLVVAPSFNGRTADSGSAYRGSNPWGAANLESTAYDLRIPPKQPTGEQKSVTFV